MRSFVVALWSQDGFRRRRGPFFPVGRELHLRHENPLGTIAYPRVEHVQHIPLDIHSSVAQLAAILDGEQLLTCFEGTHSVAGTVQSASPADGVVPTAPAKHAKIGWSKQGRRILEGPPIGGKSDQGFLNRDVHAARG